MIFWYKNSVLASIISILGCLCIIFCMVDSMRPEAVSILTESGVAGFMSFGFIFIIIAKIISVSKAKKTAAAASGAVTVKAAGASIIFAGIFFLIAAFFGLLFCVDNGISISDPGPYTKLVIEYCAYAVLMIAAFWTRASQSANILHLAAFLALGLVYGHTALRMYQIYGFEGYIASDGSTYNALALAPMIASGAFLFMVVLSVFSMRGTKATLGKVVKIVWDIPFFALALVFAKTIVDSGLYYHVKYCLEVGIKPYILPENCDVFAMLFTVLAVFCTGYAFRRCCIKAAPSPTTKP